MFNACGFLIRLHQTSGFNPGNSAMTTQSIRSTACSFITPAAVLALSLFAGCSKQEPAEALSAMQTKQPAPPSRHEEVMPEKDPADGSLLTAKLDAAGIPAKYTAHFDGDKLTRIDEVRNADGRQGEYEFYGARLVKYSGVATASAATLLIEFDMQGTVASAQADPSPMAHSEINAIRERGQLLRSHALAQRDTRIHQASQ
jgi:hypothetical protein